jgi:hypothetical protein
MAALTLFFVALVTLGLGIVFGIVVCVIEAVLEQKNVEQERTCNKLINSHHD